MTPEKFNIEKETAKVEKTFIQKIKDIKFVDIALVLAMFFNPFGFDGLFAFVMKLTGSFLVTDLIFYGMSATFFIIYFILKRRAARKELLNS